jgi:hypothetical protein
MPVLVKSRYSPGRGGHAPGDVRNAFLEGVEAMWNGDRNPVVELRDQQVPLAEVCGLLWNCNDVLPGNCVSIVQDIIRDWDRPLGSYARAARAVKEAL